MQIQLLFFQHIMEILENVINIVTTLDAVSWFIGLFNLDFCVCAYVLFLLFHASLPIISFLS